MMIFHAPMPVANGRVSGSAVRPAAMLRAFHELGIAVTLVDGTSWERSKKWEIALKSPRKIIGVYSEFSTAPIALTDPDHLPRAPFQDFAYFNQLRRRGVPVGVFYRDVYWRFPSYAKIVPVHKRLPALAFYRLEAWQLANYVDHIFLPSLRMKEHIPFLGSKVDISALPPGGVIRQVQRHSRPGPLRLFYVGAIGGEEYNLTSMLRVVSTLDGVQLTLCCRETDWKAVRGSYGNLRNVTVVHHSGAQLDQHYREADAFLMYRELVDYLRFAMPVKLGEAVGWGVPVITNANCEMGDFVERGGLGWTVKSEEELKVLLVRLRDDRSYLIDIQENVIRNRQEHSWKSRAENVMSIFTRYGSSNRI
jgi:glycosyltransferase involved in cell wall biosynthesis